MPPKQDNSELLSKIDNLIADLPQKNETKFWKTVIHDTMDVYSLFTAVWVNLITSIMIFTELWKPQLRVMKITLNTLNKDEILEIPYVLIYLITSVILTTIANYFRKIMDVVLGWISSKFGNK